MTSKITIADNFILVTKPIQCTDVIFYSPPDNPLLPVNATDERGMFFGLDYATVRPHLVEIIHSKPHIIRGNHIHEHCTEIFTVLSGEIDIYTLCSQHRKHLLRTKMTAGMSAHIPPNTAHAIYTLSNNESTAVFGDGDPRDDRERIVLIS